MMEYNNIIICGDFNLHIEDECDTEAEAFNDMMMGIGLDQHVAFTTHKAGNILDLVCTESSTSLTVASCDQGPYFSDHSAVVLSLKCDKEMVTKQTVTKRNIIHLSHEQLKKLLYHSRQII